MKFKFINIKRVYLAMILSMSGLYCSHLVAAPPEGYRGAKMMELFEQSFEETECETDGSTKWDEQAEHNQYLYQDDLLNCREKNPSKSDEQCLMDSQSRWPGNIFNTLEEIYDAFAMIEKRMEDSDINPEYIEFSIKRLKEHIFELLVIKDIFTDNDLFNKIFDQAVNQMASNSIPEILKGGPQEMVERWKTLHHLKSMVLSNDREFYRTLLNLKKVNIPVPYGSIVCNQNNVSKTTDAKTASECFVEQDSFVASLKASRKMELVERRLGKLEPLVHGLKKESIEPCGTVLGTWQASHAGQILRNSLKITAPSSKGPLPFDSKVLQKLIKKVDAKLANERH